MTPCIPTLETIATRLAAQPKMSMAADYVRQMARTERMRQEQAFDPKADAATSIALFFAFILIIGGLSTW